MLPRTTRDWQSGKSQTPELVGPATYIICGPKRLKNRAPFHSTAARKLTSVNKPYTESFYTLPGNKIQGGISPRFTASRSGVVDCPSPGPADYDVIPDPTKNESRPHGIGKLYLCKVPLSGKRSGPSIPTKLNENGYWLDEEGNIYKMPPDFHDTTLGPAFYQINEESSYHYKGCKWSKRTAKRTTFKIEEFPGPADYSVDPPVSCQMLRDEEFREIARKMTYLPRYLDQMTCKYQIEDLPGPADYNVPTKIKCKISSSIYPKPFIRGSRRFKVEINENPSPDQYDVKESKYPVSIKEAPFSNNAPRFVEKKSRPTPGPSDYFIRSPMQERLCHKFNEVGARVAPFGCSIGRVADVVSKDNHFYPSPAEYNVASGNKCKVPVSSVFKSKVKRFSVPCMKQMTDADLNFNPVKAFNSATMKTSHNAFQIAFNAKSPCVRLFDVEDNEGPAPPDYEIEKGSEIERCKGFIIPVSPRFPLDTRCLPGPADYNIHPRHTTSIYRAFDSHNLSIKESVTKKKLRRHPRETWKHWASTVKKTKQLRWFVKGGVEYIHC